LRLNRGTGPVKIGQRGGVALLPHHTLRFSAPEPEERAVVPLLLLALVADTSLSFKVPLSPAESLHVVIAGEGDPVVLIPGLFGSAYGFRNLAPLLVQAGHETIVIEPLGIGSSSRPERADYSLMAQADRVAAAMDSLGLSETVVVAHSAGGSLALRLAYRRPELVRALVSIEGGPTETLTTPEFRRAMRLAPWIKIFGGIKLIRWKIRGMLIASSGDASWVTDDVVRGYTDDAAKNLDGTLKAYLAMARVRERERLAPHLGEIVCAVRLMIGTAQHDGDVGPQEVVLLGRTLHSFAVDTVAGAGHFLHEEQPRAVVAAVARASAGDPVAPGGVHSERVTGRAHRRAPSP